MNEAPILNKVTRRVFLAGAAAVSSQLITPSFAKQSQKVDLDKFVADCIAANKDGGQAAVN